MLPKARARPLPRLGWPFGHRRNRRVRGASSEGEAGRSARPAGPSPSLWSRLRRLAITVAVVGMLGGAGWAARYYLTHARHFALKAVRTSPTRHVSAAALTARASVPLGINLFAIDREQVAKRVAEEPWVAQVHVRRELPATLVLEVREHQPACTVALGPLYLSDETGHVFKRATPKEAVGLPVVTGVARDAYIDQPEQARAAIRQALTAARAWQQGAERPALGEVHVDHSGCVTLYTERGVGVRLGAIDDTLAARLHRYDEVAASLAKSGEDPQFIYVDNRARPDRVTVKLASAQLATHSGSGD